MTDVLVKVKQLMTLAVNPSAFIDEARNAALSAVKLIHKHDLLSTPPVESKKQEKEKKKPEPEPEVKKQQSEPEGQPRWHSKKNSSSDTKDKKKRYVKYAHAGNWPQDYDLYTLKVKALRYTDTVVNELREIYESGGFKKIRIGDIVKRAVREKEIPARQYDKMKFKSFLTGQFQRLRSMGILTGQRGKKGGYFFSGD